MQSIDHLHETRYIRWVTFCKRKSPHCRSTIVQMVVRTEPMQNQKQANPCKSLQDLSMHVLIGTCIQSHLCKHFSPLYTLCLTSTAESVSQTYPKGNRLRELDLQMLGTPRVNAWPKSIFQEINL